MAVKKQHANMMTGPAEVRQPSARDVRAFQWAGGTRVELPRLW